MKNNTYYLYLIIAFLFFNSCSFYDEVEKYENVYYNDFENNSFTGWEGILIDTLFANTESQNIVLGRFNNNEINLSIGKLPKHEFIYLSFDLYILDSWDGNNTYIQGPDIWGFYVDKDEPLNSTSRYSFETTFSNSVCYEFAYCLRQSYPNPFPFYNYPKSGASQIFAGICQWKENAIGSSRYHISKLISHNDDLVKIVFYDKLVQTNTDTPLCDESWALDNISVQIVKLK